MADPDSALNANVEGRHYVDDSCIYCDLCVETAPTVFGNLDGKGAWAYVFHQPETEEEHALAFECLEGCPTASIGDRDNPGIEHRHCDCGPTGDAPRSGWLRFWSNKG